ncbi:MAG: FlgD immunoglobulin-like domain containing protein, partial [Candidatus Latescibacterota bacterium]
QRDGFDGASYYDLPYLAERQVEVQGTPKLAAAAATDARGAFSLPALPGRYTAIALPNCGRGIGTVSHVDLHGVQSLDLTLPTPARVCRIYGTVTPPAEVPRDMMILRAVDASAGLVSQTIVYEWGHYLLEAPPGEYKVYVGMANAAQGVHRVYDAGRRRFDHDGPWDIDLTAAPTAVAEAAGASLPTQTRLLPNCPNPFNGATLVRYELAMPGSVRLEVYNVLGQRVRELAAGWEQAGPHAVAWDGRDQGGRAVGTGVYLCRLQAGRRIQVRRMMLLE